MPLRGFKSATLQIDPKAEGKVEGGWIKVTLSCGHWVRKVSGRAAWHAALMHAQQCRSHALPLIRSQQVKG